MSELIPIREAARRLGVSDTAVHKAIKAGRITVDGTNPQNGRPLVTWPKCRDDWIANSTAERRTHVGGTGKSPRRMEYDNRQPTDRLKAVTEADAEPRQRKQPVNVDDDGEDIDIGDGISLAEANRIKAIYAARTAKVEHDEKVGKLVDADAAQAGWLKHIAAAKTRIMGIPAECKSRRSDLPLEVVALIDLICREALEDMANGNSQ